MDLKQGVFTITRKLLEEQLQLKENVSIRSIRYDEWDDTYRLLVEGDELPIRKEGFHPDIVDYVKVRK